MNNELILPKIAENDFYENIIRPTYYEKPFHDSQISSRLTMKALMLQAVLEQVTDSIPLVEDLEISSNSRSYADKFDLSSYYYPFDIALYRNKAMGRDVETAMRFTEVLADYDIIGYGYAGRPKLLATGLLMGLHNFSFRPTG